MSADAINPLTDIALPLIITLIGGLILAIVGVLFQKKIRIWLRGIRIVIFNERFKIRLFYKYLFNIEPISTLQPRIFEILKDRFPQYELTKITTRPDLIVLKPEKLGVRILIHLSSVSDLLSIEEGENNQDEQKIRSHELEITLGDDLRLGYSEINDLIDYLMIFNEIKNIVKTQCFNNTDEINGFIVCDVVRGYDQISPEKMLVLTDENATVSFMNKNLKITLKNYEYFDRIIRKYISY